jgi:hypothetical protein
VQLGVTQRTVGERISELGVQTVPAAQSLAAAHARCTQAFQYEVWGHEQVA